MRHEISLWRDGCSRAWLEESGLWKVGTEPFRCPTREAVILVAAPEVKQGDVIERELALIIDRGKLLFTVAFGLSPDGKTIVIHQFRFGEGEGLQVLQWALLALCNPSFEALLMDLRMYEKRLYRVRGDEECPTERFTAEGVETAADWLERELSAWPIGWR